MSLNLEVLEKDEYNLIFTIEGITVEMANALRRIILTEIPVMAVDEVIILKNDSPLYDEIIAHRLGMIPLKTDLDTYKLPQECECGGYGCPLCQVSLTCEIHNTDSKPKTINSGDLKSNDPKVIPVNDQIPILKIDRNDKFIIEAYCSLGTGKQHAKYSAVSNIYYRYFPEIEFDDSKCEKCPDKCIVSRMCPKRLYDFSNNKKPNLVKDYWKECDLCDACRTNCPKEAIKINIIDNKYIFFVESDGVLPFDVLISKTFEIFNEKIDEFEEKFEGTDIEIQS